MLEQEYKVDCSLLVVFDKQKIENSLLVNAVNFAKLINGAINILFVINPISSTSSDSQLNILKWLEDEFLKAEVKLKKLVNEIYKQERIPVVFSIETGNYLSVVKSHVEKTSPDVIVLENNRFKNFFSFKKKIVPNYLNKFNGLIFLSGDTHYTLPKSRLILSCFEPKVFLSKNKLLIKLLENASDNIHVFRSNRKNSAISLEKFKSVLDKKMTVFEFEPNKEKLGISKYLNHSNTDILCIYNPINGEKTPQYYQYEDVIVKNKLPLLIIQN